MGQQATASGFAGFSDFNVAKPQAAVALGVMWFVAVKRVELTHI